MNFKNLDSFSFHVLIHHAHRRQPKEYEKGFTGRINKGKQIIISEFSSYRIFSGWLI
jgi:hypothetical protein